MILPKWLSVTFKLPHHRTPLIPQTQVWIHRPLVLPPDAEPGPEPRPPASLPFAALEIKHSDPEALSASSLADVNQKDINGLHGDAMREQTV